MDALEEWIESGESLKLFSTRADGGLYNCSVGFWFTPEHTWCDFVLVFDLLTEQLAELFAEEEEDILSGQHKLRDL